MVWILLLAHVIGIVACGVLGRRSMRTGLLVAAIAPAITAAWAVAGLATQTEPTIRELVWVEGLDLSFRFRIDELALMMTLLVSGIGTLVFAYATGYFDASADGGARFPPALLAFSTSMLGLVWADSVWTLFIFWELTSITSFLLVGYKNTSESVRTAARRALLLTGGGGLALLGGLLVLTNGSGTSTLTDLRPINGGGASIAALLIIVGAATKSAQVPFHVWLPGAMAAPTPVSAYLHSATMVKAGVLLVAVAGPAFTDIAAWKLAGIGVGGASVIWGALGALRHRDAKLILAWGTVSQLGLMITLLAAGSPKATFAALAIVFAHAIFKAALFLVVGEIDIRTGTRDITELRGLARSMPLACASAIAAGLSMAGAPLLLGFTAKEAAIEAALGLDGLEKQVVSVVVIGGSVLTVAYTIRLLIGLFGNTPSAGTASAQVWAPTPVAPSRPAMAIPSAFLAIVSVVGFFVVGIVNDIVVPAVTELDEKAAGYRLVAWPGLKTAFVVSLAILLLGSMLGALLARRPIPPAPSPVGAELADSAIDGILRVAVRVTAHVQHGSLPVYLVTTFAVVTVATIPFVAELSVDRLVWWDNPAQGFLALVVAVSAIAGAFVDSRLGAALTLGAVGTGVTGLFVAHGAPDLALTQLLVETVIVVGFVLGLGRLSQRFPSPTGSWKLLRISLAGLGGAAVMVGLIASGSRPVGQVPLEALADGSLADGGGKNIVNVILTDIRGLDTLGEVVVLATVAIGILALATAHRSEDPS